MLQSFVTALWESIKRPVLALSLVVFQRWLGAERVHFVDDYIDAGYATYRTLATVRVPVETLFPVQVGRGPVPISSTPHFSFVRAHLGHEGAGWNKNDWKKYMTQGSASSVSAVA